MRYVTSHQKYIEQIYMYTILITVSLNSIVQTAFMIWLWFHLYKTQPLMITQAEAYPSAPILK